MLGMKPINYLKDAVVRGIINKRGGRKNRRKTRRKRIIRKKTKKRIKKTKRRRKSRSKNMRGCSSRKRR